MVQTINNHQSWPSLQQTSLDKCHTATANHRQGKPDSYPSMEVQKKTSYPSMHGKRHCIKGAARAQNSGISMGVRKGHYKISRAGVEPATTILQEASQGIKCMA